MISKYLQIQLFYIILILFVPYIVSYISKLIINKEINDKIKGHIAAGVTILCALLWLIYGRNMIKE